MPRHDRVSVVVRKTPCPALGQLRAYMVEKSASVPSCCHYGRSLIPFCLDKGHLGDAQELLGNLIAVNRSGTKQQGSGF